jgi:hypothetical protein
MERAAYAQTALTRRKDEKRRKYIAKEFRDSLLCRASTWLNDAKKTNGGRLPFGKMAEVIQDLADHGVHVSRNVLNKLVVKYATQAKATSVEELTTVPLADITVEVQTNISSLPGVDGVEDIDITKKAGRPKGTTVNDLNKENTLKDKCKANIAIAYASHKTKMREAGRDRVSKGYLRKLIRDTKLDLGISENYYIAEKTIFTRLSVKRLNPSHPGVESPLLPAEESLVQICIAMGNARQPLTPTEGLHLMNSLIKDSELQEKLISFKRQRRLGNSGEVGRSYWTLFMRRNAHRLVTKRGERFASNRADWSKMSYIKQMYDVIYDQLVDARVARLREIPVFMNRAGEIVDESEKYGEPVDIDVLHPDYILFGDETGCNTSQQKDGHEGGRKYLCGKDQVPKTSCVTSDHRFTLLPITTASGEPVVCVVIFQGSSKDVPGSWASGIDIQLEPTRGENGKIRTDESNFGKGKYFPNGPTCSFRGKEIPTLTYITESGGVNGDILVSVLQTLDALDVFPRVPGGPVPFLIIDGHESRLAPTFLKYINDENHIWCVCLGVPYATSYWQVGDSAEQNGCFKIIWYQKKREMVTFKRDRGLPMVIGPEDIIPTLNRCFHHSYGRPRVNRNATSDRGWTPLNRKLQSHPELMDPDDAPERTPINHFEAQVSTDGSTSTISDLNLDGGYSADVLDRIIQQRMKTGGIERRQQRLQEGSRARKSLEEAKRVTSGILVGNGIHSLNDNRLLEKVQQREKEDLDKERDDAKKKRAGLLSRIRKVQTIREEKGQGTGAEVFLTWSARQCRDYLQYKRRDEDAAMPKTVGPLRVRCDEVRGRTSPTASPHPSDDEASIGDVPTREEDTDGDVLAPNTSHGGEDAAASGASEDNESGDFGEFSAQI